MTKSMLNELKKLIENWKQYHSFTEDMAYDLGRENAHFSCSEELEDLLNKYESSEKESFEVLP